MHLNLRPWIRTPHRTHSAELRHALKPVSLNPHATPDAQCRIKASSLAAAAQESRPTGAMVWRKWCWRPSRRNFLSDLCLMWYYWEPDSILKIWVYQPRCQEACNVLIWHCWHLKCSIWMWRHLRTGSRALWTPFSAHVVFIIESTYKCWSITMY